MALLEGLKRLLPRGVPGVALDEKLSGAEWQLPDKLGPLWHYMPAPQPDKIILGWAEKAGQRVLVGCKDNRHLLTIGGTRSGKGVSLLIPNLLFYGTGTAGGPGNGGSILAIDPKGELARLTRRTREEVIGQRCFVLDPFNATDGMGGFASDGFNPMAELGKYHEDSIDKAGVIADALVQSAGNDPHWGDSARMFVRALILFNLMMPKADLGAVRDLLMLKHEVLAIKRAESDFSGSDEALLFALMKNAGSVKAYPYAHVVGGVGATFMDMGDRERSSILSTARTQTEFLDSPALRRVIEKSSFKVADLKDGFEEEDGTRRNVTVYVCLPAKYLGYYNRWLRVIVNLMLAGLEGDKNAPDIPVLLCCDEFSSLGHMRSIETGAGLIASSGVRIWSVLQDLSQLKTHYRHSWETFIGNAGILTFFGNTDATTLDYISKRLGQRGLKVMMPTGASPGALYSGGSSEQQQLHRESLWAPHEIEQGLRREMNLGLVLMAGEKPVLLDRVTYYKEEPFLSRWKKEGTQPV